MLTAQRILPPVRMALLVTHYAIACGAVLDSGNCMDWLLWSLAAYALLVLTFWLSPLSSAPAKAGHQPRFLPRTYERALRYFFLTASLLWLAGGAMPVHAQFFGDAQAFIAGCFSQAVTLVSLVFNVLRFLLLIYLGISLIQGVNAVRDGQNLASVATPPLIVVVIVVAADFATTLIIGGATC